MKPKTTTSTGRADQVDSAGTTGAPMHISTALLSLAQSGGESLASVRQKEWNMILWCGAAIVAVLVLWVVVRVMKRR
jgi:hypothetical protein